MDAADFELIRGLIPFNRMSESDLTAVLDQSEVQKLPKSKMIFKRAEEDDKVYWLLTGGVDLLDEKFEAKHRKAGEEVTRNPIDNNSPHRLTAIQHKAVDGRPLPQYIKERPWLSRFTTK